MTIINSLSLNPQQKQSVELRVKERVTTKFNLTADFNKIKGNEVDFSALDKSKTNESVSKLENMIGKQYSIPVKTNEGLDGEIQYTEVNGTHLYNVSTKTKNSKILKKLREFAKSDENFNKLFAHLVKEGYLVDEKEAYVLQTEKYLEDQEGTELSHSQNMFTVPVYQGEDPIGILAIDEHYKTPVIVIGNENTFVHENGEIVTIQADSCSLKWTKCMAKYLGCSSWPACLITFGGCLGACCTCLNPFSCIACAACAAAVVGAAWKCRMCVVGAARPKECPV
ncbi:hypothetical protein ShirakiTB12_54690 [Priestia megaterium]|uniref:Uncharacterized protein n=1 Tax=Priestia megaterium TaxID=1404 RepID=A0AAX6BTG6_PRIMG|nr:hypothetical protein [Priestia megaterium]GMG77000.1 hypothetical protein ShirakiTB12_54690 [Priestia megaterium]